MSIYTADEAGVRLWFADRGLSEVADNLSGFGWQLSTFTKLFALDKGVEELETKAVDIEIDDDFIIVRTLPRNPARCLHSPKPLHRTKRCPAHAGRAWLPHASAHSLRSLSHTLCLSRLSRPTTS